MDLHGLFVVVLDSYSSHFNHLVPPHSFKLNFGHFPQEFFSILLLNILFGSQIWLIKLLLRPHYFLHASQESLLSTQHAI